MFSIGFPPALVLLVILTCVFGPLALGIGSGQIKESYPKTRLLFLMAVTVPVAPMFFGVGVGWTLLPIVASLLGYGFGRRMRK